MDQDQWDEILRAMIEELVPLIGPSTPEHYSCQLSELAAARILRSVRSRIRTEKGQETAAVR